MTEKSAKDRSSCVGLFELAERMDCYRGGMRSGMMSTEQMANVPENLEIVRGAAKFRRYLIASHARFAAFGTILIAGGILAGMVSFRAGLYGFAFSGFVGALAAAMMVWIAILQIIEIRNESDRSILFLGPRQVATSAEPEKPEQPPPS